MQLPLRIFIYISVLAMASCMRLDLAKEVPACVTKQIREIANEEPQHPPTEVWEWKTDGITYYYFTSGCCDRFNYLYDSNCNVVCAPDGGITGKGDGKCPEFRGTVEKTLIWKDTRK